MTGALSVPRSTAPRNCGGAAAAVWASAVFSSQNRTSASPGNRKSAFADAWREAMCGEAKEIANEFGRIADVAGLTSDERAALFGEGRELSRVILALETIGAALDLFQESDAAVAWMRAENFAEPFNGRAPLELMVANGRLGVEISLLYLRARLRLASCG